MVDASDLSPGTDLPCPYEATVVQVDSNVQDGRRAEVVLEDDGGYRVLFVDYAGAETGVDWQRNSRYRFANCRVQCTNRSQHVSLAPSKKTEITEVGPTGHETKLLFIGDTHVGRTRHPKQNGTRIDPVAAFARAAEVAVERDVDAVVHAGDLFHDTDDCGLAAEVDSRVLTPLAEHGIPFYYVTGNHGHDVRDALLDGSHLGRLEQLGADGKSIDGTVRLCGVDHPDSGGRPLSNYRFPRAPDEPFTILVIHRTIKQLPLNDTGTDLDDISGGPVTGFDLVVAGHNHDSREAEWDGGEGFYTGAAAHMSTNSDPTDGLAWLVTVCCGSSERDQVQLTDAR